MHLRHLPQLLRPGDLLAAGVDRKALARRIVQVFCQQIFVDGALAA